LILGTSLIVLPVDIAEMLNAQIGAKKSWNGQYLVDCSKVPDLPELSFYFGGKAYPLKGSDYVLEVQGTCMSSFTPMNLPGGLWIIGMSSLGRVNLTMTNRMITGDVFLRRYYTVYDLGRDAIGFAKSV
jgi:saccharopepsin